MADANKITVITRLSSCDDTTLNLNRTVQDLYNLYRTNLSNVFLRVSVINYNCTRDVENYFEQMIIFTQSVSIRIQILFAAVYSDYINANNYQFNGFSINRQAYFSLSSISLNNMTTTDACSSGDIARDPFCLTNSSNPLCTILSNRWNYACSSTYENNTHVETPILSGLNTWQLGLVCSLSVIFVVLLLILLGYFYRRHRHSKQIALSRLNLYNDSILMQKNGIPYGRAFHRATTIIQPQRNNNTAISWIQNDTTTNGACIKKNRLNAEPLELHHQGKFNDHAKVHEPGFPLNISRNSITPINIPVSSANSTAFKTCPTIVVSRSASEKSKDQLKSIADEYQEDKFNESDNISMDQSVLNNSRTPLTKHWTDVSSIDESLSDEDAWMSILDVVNAELAILDEQDHIRVLM